MERLRYHPSDFSDAIGTHYWVQFLHRGRALRIGVRITRRRRRAPLEPRIFAPICCKQRVLFYVICDERQRNQIKPDTRKLQVGLWSTTPRAAAAQPAPLVAVAVAGAVHPSTLAQPNTSRSMGNDGAGRHLFLVGYGEHRRGAPRLLVLPLIMSIPLFLIGDIDSPRGGVIRVHPQNLISLPPIHEKWSKATSKLPQPPSVAEAGPG
jgi:hypothetical protein